MIFETFNNLLYSMAKNDTFNKIAAFDLDNTIIKTISGKKIPIDKNDWVFNFSNVKEILYNYYNQCYKIIIFTNQPEISTNKINKNDFIDKINNIHQELNIEFDIFISTDLDYFRKPMSGMWDFFIEKYGIFIDKKNSFYCGNIFDHKNDINYINIRFAYNIGLHINIPENIFEKKNLNIPKDEYINLSFPKQKNTIKPKKEREMIILVGKPNSGKTEFTYNFTENYKNYIGINLDDKLYKKKIKDAFINKNSIILDSTNSTKKSRNKYIELAKKNNIFNVRIIVFDISTSLAKHINHYRAQLNHTNILSNSVYHNFDKTYEEPTLNEGVYSIEKITFSFTEKLNNKIFNYHFDI